MSERPYEIRLNVQAQKDGGYSASWIESGGQQSETFALALPLTDKDREQIFWYLEDYIHFAGVGDLVTAQQVERRLEELGSQLDKALFGTAETRQVYNNLMGATRADNPGLLTIGSADPAVLAQPWELLRDRRGPLAFQDVIIRRQLLGADRPRSFDLDLPLRVLLIVSRPEKAGFIDPRNSIPPLLDAMEALPEGTVEIDFCEPPTLERASALLGKAHRDGKPYHIVHFDGHGTYLPETSVGVLIFEDEKGEPVYVSGKDFGDQLARASTPLVILEACRGSQIGDRPVIGSVAPALLQAGIGSVVAFSHSVHIYAARLLVETFYQELAGGRAIGQALAEARVRLHANRKRFRHLGPDAPKFDLQDWFIAQLYQVGEDLRLIPPDKAARGELRPQRVIELPGFPPAPQYRFHGRAYELLKLERAFRKDCGVLLAGMGGMGKTALAREAAHWWLRTGRFERAVFCSFENKPGVERALQLLGEAFDGTEFHALPAAEQRKRAVQLFREKAVLLVWDNFESVLPAFQHNEGELNAYPTEQYAAVQALYAELSAGKPLGRLLVTCRPAESGLRGIRTVPLEGLARHDSLSLVEAALDRLGIESEGRRGFTRANFDLLLNKLADHPLSIELVAPHLKARSPGEIALEFEELLKDLKQEAGEERNTSLLASLDFSRRHLSAEAQAALPLLAWFSGGVFEMFFLMFSEIDEAAWGGIREELAATALLRVETYEAFNSHYLRFHPTLPSAARRAEAADPAAVEARFVEVYAEVARLIRDSLFGQQAAVGMALAGLEEANLRRALEWALAGNRRAAVSSLAEALGVYLGRSAWPGEQAALAERVRAGLAAGAGERLDNAACNAILADAWACFQRGEAGQAVEWLQELIARLEAEGPAEGADPAFQMAVANNYLGRVYVEAGRPDLALEPCGKAIRGLEELGQGGEGNLSAALGDRANALRDLGRLDEALADAQRATGISRRLNNPRNLASGLVREAAILTNQQRYTEAEGRYREALAAARQAGDEALEGTTYQHLGELYRCLGRYDEAVEQYRLALARFQAAGDRAAEMRTCNLLGSAGQQRGGRAAARAWYERSLELARGLQDEPQQAATLHNLGVLDQNEAEDLPEGAQRAGLLRRAAAQIEESLALSLARRNEVYAASSYSQLGDVYRLLGELDKAETNARQALSIRERLGLPEVYKDYWNMADIAEARGDAQTVAEWQAKRDAKIEELKRLQRGEGAAVPQAEVDQQLYKPVLALAQAAYRARVSGAALPPDAAEALAQVANLPAPLGEMAGFLRSVAEGQPIPPVPGGLPKELADILQAVVEAL